MLSRRGDRRILYLMKLLILIRNGRVRQVQNIIPIPANNTVKRFKSKWNNLKFKNKTPVLRPNKMAKNRKKFINEPNAPAANNAPVAAPAIKPMEVQVNTEIRNNSSSVHKIPKKTGTPQRAR